MKYNYVDATLDDLVSFLVTAKVANTSSILAHYKNNGDAEMYAKIHHARELAHKIKKEKRREQVVFDWHDVVYYDETSPSCLRWKSDRHLGPNQSVKFAYEGEVAGGSNGSKYLTYRFMYKYVTYLAHRVVWELFNGKIGEKLQIDHIDGDSTNNKISNLRVVDQSINSKNCKRRKDNSSGTCGVGLDSTTKNGVLYQYWVAYFMRSVGVSDKKYFSIKKYGYDGAYKLACEYRAKMLEELNKQGAGYTDRHGT